MQTNTTFGSWLRQRRRMRDLTQQALADEVGCARITLRRIEANELIPSKQLAALLLTAVGIPPVEQETWIPFARGRAGLPSAGLPQMPLPGNLPAALTTFIGRDQEQADLRQLLGSQRLVTLVGPGGVGKTRLALETSRQVAGAFDDGVWLVELAALADPALLPQTVATTVGVPPSPVLPLSEVLVNFLRPKTTLIILDNCEHLLDACAHLADNLLKHCPNLALLATSREPLGILGEAIYHANSLHFPETTNILQQYQQFESLSLFAERARLVQTNFKLSMDNLTAVAQICRHLDGIPLAIELAAIHVDHYSPAEIAAQLAQCFDLLSGGSRTALPRQQTMRASIDWSWNLLTSAEQVLLRRLAVFNGGWTREAAHTVCSDESLTTQQINALLAQLAHKSLLVVNPAAGSGTRYTFHEVVCYYANERLVEAGEAELLRQRHAAYFLTLAETAEPKLHSAEQAHWLDLLSYEVPNLRAGLESALEQDEETALRLAAALAWFWFHRGLLEEGRRWLNTVLAASRQEGPTRSASAPDQELNYRNALCGAGLLAHYQGDYLAARALLEECLALSQEADDKNGIARALLLLGMGSVWLGNFATADQQFNESTALLRSTEDTWQLAHSLNNQGFLLILRGVYADARRLLEEGLLYARESGDGYGLSMLLANLGTMEYQQGNIHQGQALLEESLAAARKLHDPTVTGWALKELGHIARYHGDYARAVELYESVLEECRVAGLVTGSADMLRALGDVATRKENYSEARSLLQESLTLFHEQGSMQNVLLCLSSFAALACAEKAWLTTVKLLGFLDTQFADIGLFMPPIDRADFEKIAASTRQALDAQTFEAVWLEGRIMSLDQAVMLVQA